MKYNKSVSIIFAKKKQKNKQQQMDVAGKKKTQFRNNSDGISCEWAVPATGDKTASVLLRHNWTDVQPIREREQKVFHVGSQTSNFGIPQNLLTPVPSS